MLRMRTLALSAALPACATSLLAQIATTATVTVPIQVQVTGYTSAVRAVGPLPAAGVLVTSGINLDRSQVHVTPYAPSAGLGGVGWEVITDLRSDTDFGTAPTAASATGRLEFLFTSPQPRAGVLRLIPNSWDGSLSLTTGGVDVDLGCDGVADYQTRTASYTELPLTVDSAGARICLALGMSITVGPQPGTNIVGGAFQTWQLEFVPDVYGVEPFANGCIGGLQWNRGQGGELQLWLHDPNQPGPGPTIGGGFLLLGLGPTALPLPNPPYCTQWVAAPTLIAPQLYTDPWSIAWSLPALRLPPGLVFHAQVVWWNWYGSLFATKALRSF